MKINEIITEGAETYQPPELAVGDKILKGKFKNSPAEIKGFKKDKHNQPVLKTNKGDVQLFKPRLKKLMTNEGGWASTLTQGTIITPFLVQKVMKILQAEFVPVLNTFLEGNKQLGPTKISRPGGSATYYERDIKQNPKKEYGDVDVQFHVPRLHDVTANANFSTYQQAIKEFCDSNPNYSTENGTNVILKLGTQYVQVDLIMSFYENEDWTRALAPEWNLKGVLCNSLYSSLGEVLNLSIGGGHGVQGKYTADGTLVPFRTVKDVELKTITNNPKTWASDIAKFFDCKKISPRLKQFPGMLDEIRVADMINSIRGIAETLELNDKLPGDFPTASDLLKNIKGVYLQKIEKVINSPKFDKAETPQAIEQAKHTKEMLAQKSANIAALFGA